MLRYLYPYMSKPKTSYQIEVPVELIKELLTDSEWRMIKQRLLIIQLLKEGLSIRVVAAKAKVGTDTVVRMIRKLESSVTLRETFRSIQQSSTQSKWVFGQSETKK